MNKVLHVLVYVFLALASAALWFELQLNAKRDELTDRNRMQEDYLVKLARTIEKAEPDKNAATLEIRKDISPVEAKPVDSPEMENVLESYKAELEQVNLETYNWDGQRNGLRSVYVRDFDGHPVMDGNHPQTRNSDEDKMLEQLFNSAKTQQSRLNSTRAALADIREKLESAVAEINKLKPESRQDKMTIEELNEKIAKLEEEKTEFEGKILKHKTETEELNGEITSKNDEIARAKDEIAAKEEELEKAKQLIEKLKELLKNSVQTQGAAAAGTASAVVASLPAGDKGKVIEADNENMFAIVQFSDEAMKELKGDNPSNALPAIELGVKRPGFNGPAGEFVGKIRLRQEVKGKNYVICDILGSWEQDKLAVNDVIFAD
ncbi:MAG: hypothetical protein IJH50_11210 [Kiritimatiellae bacterium]|nr:hypothetical protein [Kiritimatiellia bacterium]